MTVEVPEKRIYKAAIITDSDKGSKGEREDLSGPAIQEMIEPEGYLVTVYTILPDDQETLENEMKRIADEKLADVIFTTGGTGFSPRDVTPEATIAVCDRLVPGIPEAMRAYSMTITPKAMLSRAAAGIRKDTLIINMPGSPKAVKESLEYILNPLRHGLDILLGEASECARK
ncbi:MAG: MogA/MoaB family molybdenum cofactor biosynthesis protein [Clostridia bacterium]|nr:MogA/MoaB family molybdenum cofactor biosynthesis protein [Clostridia bacterium]